MTTSPSSLAIAVRLLAEGRLGEVFARLRARLSGSFYRRELAYEYRRDLQIPFDVPSARIPIHVREATESDAAILFDLDEPGLKPADRQERAWRLAHFRKNIPTCYVAIDERNGRPCYAQWLMTDASNAAIRALGPFPRLRPDEALFENAYTPRAYRGLGVHIGASIMICDQAKRKGKRFVLAYVGSGNRASLKAAGRAAFERAAQRTITTWLFNLVRRVEFQDLDGRRVDRS